MPLSPQKKLALWIMCSAYIVLLVVLLSIGYAGKEHHPKHDEIIKGFIEVAEKCDHKLSDRDAAEMYERFVVEKGEVFGLNYTAIMQIINFSVLAILLYMFLWQPMIAFLDQRREEIREDINSARKRNADAQEALTEYQSKLTEARAERQAMVEDGKRDGRQERDAIIAQARSQAERVVEDAQREIAAEVARARDELRREVSSISVQVAQHILEREIQPTDHEAMIEDLIKEIESADLTV